MTDEQPKPEIIDKRDAKGKFAKGNTIGNLAKRDPTTGFPVPKDIGIAVVRRSDGTVERIPLPIQQIEQVLLDRILAKYKDVHIEEARKVADETAREVYADLIEHAGGDPIRLITARMATHVQNGKLLKAVDAMMDRAAEGNMKGIEMMLKLLAKVEEMSGARGGDGEGVSESDAQALDELERRYGQAEEVDRPE